jgi:fermentation-respiration switch protein FrsA (DUF1100 family)
MQLTTGPGPEVSPRWSPDGTRIACLSIPRKGSHRDVFRLAIIRFKDGESNVTVLPDYDHLSFPLPEQCWEDDERLSFNYECGVYSGVGRRNAVCGALAPPPFSPSDTGLRALLPRGNQFLRDRLEAQVTVVKWRNDGLRLEGILTTPPASVAQPPYKLIVHPHGGPHSRSTLGFDFTVQVLAAHGYAVFQPNFRGSSGYGQWFIDADHGDFGGGDMRDILAGIDCLVKKGLVDPQRQFVYGTSYGGFMTTWLVGHTKQFRAAVAQNAVTDLNMMWSLSDLQSWVEWEFGLPWEVPDKLRKHSPLTYADQVETPTLILHSRDDRRCPLPMGKAFHQALLARGVPTVMVIYPDEGHGIRQPRHREDVLRRVLAWFAKYDQ